MRGENFKCFQVPTRGPNRMPGVLDRPCSYFVWVPVQGLKPGLERGLQESLRRLRFTRQLNSGIMWRGGSRVHTSSHWSQVELSVSATSSPNHSPVRGLGSFVARPVTSGYQADRLSGRSVVVITAAAAIYVQLLL